MQKPDQHIAARLHIVWPVTHGVLISLQAMLSALVLFGPARIDAGIAQQLTSRGLALFRPEHDVLIYALGCVLTAFLIALSLWLLRRRTARDDGKTRERLVRAGAAQLLALMVLTVAQLGWLLALRWMFIFETLSVPAFSVFVLALPTVASLAIAFGIGERNLPRAPQAFTRWLGASARVSEWSRFSVHGGFDIIVPLMLCAVIYIPATNRLAGAICLREQFHHWDFFAMGPALAFDHGKALGTEAFAQYGVGWPLVFNALSGLIPMTYGNFIKIGALYACSYFIGVYALLRLMLSSATWAATGVGLALSLQLFHGIGFNETMWCYPSATVMRSPLDVWFFIALFLHLRTARRGWGLLAGALVGSAVLFETDTGIYLAGVFAAYWAFSLGLANTRVRARLAEGFAAFGVGAAALLCGLAIASRGTLVRREFWSGWTESLRSYGAGVSMLPIASAPDATLLLFAFIIAVYLAVMGSALLALLRRESVPATVLLGCIGSYGLLAMILFVGRSHPFNVFHVSVPFCIVVAALISRINGLIENYGATQRVRSTHEFWVSMTMLLPWGALAAVVLWLLVNPAFRDYPGALQSMSGEQMIDRSCLLRDPLDVCGLPPVASSYIAAFDATTRAIRERAASGQSVAVLDETDTIFYLAAGAKPWWRYAPSFTAIIRRPELAALERELAEQGPEIIFIRANDFHSEAFHTADVWKSVHSAVARLYTPDSATGIFQIWRRNEE